MNNNLIIKNDKINHNNMTNLSFNIDNDFKSLINSNEIRYIDRDSYSSNNPINNQASKPSNSNSLILSPSSSISSLSSSSSRKNTAINSSNQKTLQMNSKKQISFDDTSSNQKYNEIACLCYNKKNYIF